MEQRAMRHKLKKNKSPTTQPNGLWTWVMKNPAMNSSKKAFRYLRTMVPSTFVMNSIRLLKRCTKPDRQEFQRTAIATATGFVIMGSLGYAVKLLHIPIINILMG